MPAESRRDVRRNSIFQSSPGERASPNHSEVQTLRKLRACPSPPTDRHRRRGWRGSSLARDASLRTRQPQRACWLLSRYPCRRPLVCRATPSWQRPTVTQLDCRCRARLGSSTNSSSDDIFRRSRDSYNAATSSRVPLGWRGSGVPRLPSPLGARRVTPVPRPLALERCNASGPDPRVDGPATAAAARRMNRGGPQPDNTLAVWSLQRRQTNPVSNLDHDLTPLPIDTNRLQPARGSRQGDDAASGQGTPLSRDLRPNIAIPAPKHRRRQTPVSCAALRQDVLAAPRQVVPTVSWACGRTQHGLRALEAVGPPWSRPHPVDRSCRLWSPPGSPPWSHRGHRNLITWPD